MGIAHKDTTYFTPHFIQEDEPVGYENATWYKPSTKAFYVFKWNKWNENEGSSGGGPGDTETINVDNRYYTTNYGSLWTWGSNNTGQLGLNDTVERSSPTQVGTDTDWSSFENFAYSASTHRNYNIGLASKSNGSLWTWGFNTNGELGQNDTITRSSPTQVGSDTDWLGIKSSVGYSGGGGANVHVIKSDGTYWVWGKEYGGVLGLNNDSDKQSPTQLGTDTIWNRTDTNEYNVLATKTDGTLWTWGYNTYGQLGMNDNIWRSSPVQLGTDTNWNTVTVATENTGSLKTDGTLWKWGRNGYGQLGLNDTVNRSSPVQVGTDTNWSYFVSGYYQNIAIKSNGTLWGWGDNGYGQLGLNDTVNRSSPTQIGADTTWILAKTGNNQTLLKKSDGTLWVCGYSSFGELGLSSQGAWRSSPTQIGTDTDWSYIHCGTSISGAIKSS